MNTSQQRSFGLDLMRAIAISLVLLSHFVTSVSYMGHLGVELFFALSGYLIGHILWRSFSETGSWTFASMFNFWSRRWWRTVPNYYLFLVVNVLLIYFYKENSLLSLEQFFKFIWFGQYLTTHQFGFYLISWSLCIEEWFYLLFPIILYAFNKAKLKPKVSFILTIAVFFIGSAVVRYVLSNNGELSLRTITLARLDSIACGVAVAYFFVTLKPDQTWKIISFVTGLILILSVQFIPYLTSITHEQLMQSSVVLFVLPLGASLTLPLISRLPSKLFSKFISLCIERLSLWSYSIYLVHLPIMWAVYNGLTPIRGTVYGNLLSKVIGLVLTITVAAFLYRFFEIPLMRKRPRELTVRAKEFILP